MHAHEATWAGGKVVVPAAFVAWAVERDPVAAVATVALVAPLQTPSCLDGRAARRSVVRVEVEGEGVAGALGVTIRDEETLLAVPEGGKRAGKMAGGGKG